MFKYIYPINKCMDLISQLKEEHLRLLRSAEISTLGEFKDILVTHLDVENKLIYPKLTACKKEKPKKLGKKFSEEMLKISVIIMDFFDKYEQIDVDELRKNSVFKKRFKEVLTVLKKRIDVEENILFPAFEECVDK